MPATLFALQIFLILLPGFTAAYIVHALSTPRPQTDLERIIEALVFSFLIYASYVLFNAGQLPFRVLVDPAGKVADTVVWEPERLGWLVAITFAFSLIAVAYNRYDGKRIFRWVYLTERTTKGSPWNDVFESVAKPGQPVQVELSDGRSVLGVLSHYSTNSDDTSLFLEQASWVDANGQAIPIPGPGILLTKASGIQAVSLLDPAPPAGTLTSSAQTP